VLDPEQLQEFGKRAKVQIRSRMRGLRDAYPASALAERSQKIVERIQSLDVFREAGAIGLFWPMRGEVDLRSLDELARGLGKKLYYPVMDREDAESCSGLALTERSDALVPRGSGFFEPPPEAARAGRGEVDLIVVPALAVSSNGHRLGYGRGFYDSLLPDFRPPGRALVVAFEFQLLVELPTEAHDVPCDVIVTDGQTLMP
jgi:5-formyltetrahydrofolate cyclo-ligase